MKSAFTRRIPAARAQHQPPGTRYSVYNQSLLCSTGVASFDDVLGGGLPLGSILLLEQDEHSSYGDLIQKFFVAQGLQCPGHHVAVLSSRLQEGGGPGAFMAKLPAVDQPSVSQDSLRGSDDELPSARDEALKIAFRYQGLKSADARRSPTHEPAQAVYCSTFDLTSYMPVEAGVGDRVHLIDTTPDDHATVPLHEHLSELAHIVETKNFSKELYRFLLGLRHLLRGSLACAMVTIRPSLMDAVTVRRIQHAADSVVSLQSFAGRPDLAEMFPRYAGLVHVLTLPALETLVPPSTRLSVLRGTSGKNDLAFRLKRRRFVIETLHLDIDGGVDERRTPKKGREADKVTPSGFKPNQPALYDF